MVMLTWNIFYVYVLLLINTRLVQHISVQYMLACRGVTLSSLLHYDCLMAGLVVGGGGRCYPLCCPTAAFS